MSTRGGRDPLVRIKINSNARAGSSTRRSLPAAGYQKDPMDRNSPKQAPMVVTPAIKSYYLDSDDDR